MAFLMPTTGIATVDKFELEFNDSFNELVSGAAYSNEQGEAYWEVSMGSSNLTIRSGRYQAWRAFLDSLRGRKKGGYFYDPRKPYPANYPQGLGGLVVAGTSYPFNGDAFISSFVNRNRIVVNSLPPNFVLKRTDYVSFMKGGHASLHRLIADVNADGSGVATITVEPRVPTAYDTTSIVRFVRAPFLGVLDGTPSDSSDVEKGRISFKARSVVTWGGGNMDTSGWILANGMWDDNGVWVDDATWPS